MIVVLRALGVGDLPTGVSIVHPGAKAAQRRWPPARFAAVARYLTARGHRVVVTGSPTSGRSPSGWPSWPG